MARDSNGNYSLPAGTLVNAGDQVLPSQHNPAMQDIAQALTQSLSRSGAGGMNGPINMQGNSLQNCNNVEAAGSVTAGGDGTFANLNIVAGNKVKFGSETFYAQIIGGRQTIFFDSSNNHYLQWAPDINRVRLVLYGQVVANFLPSNAGAIFLGPVIQNGSPT
jgi:hypothetical protein